MSSLDRLLMSCRIVLLKLSFAACQTQTHTVFCRLNGFSISPGHHCSYVLFASLSLSLSLSYFSEHECALHTPVEQQQQPSSLPKDAEVELYSLFFS